LFFLQKEKEGDSIKATIADVLEREVRCAMKTRVVEKGSYVC